MKLVLQLPEINLSLCTIPKNGGTTLWNWAHLLRKGELPEVKNVYLCEPWLASHAPVGETVLVVRDPVERFVSGYQNFVEFRELKSSFDQFVDDFPSLFQSDRNVSHHFRPQFSYHQGITPQTADHVFRVGDMRKIKTLLEEKSGKVLPDLQQQKSYSEKPSPKPWQLELIRSFYQRDYELGFGD